MTENCIEYRSSWLQQGYNVPVRVCGNYRCWLQAEIKNKPSPAFNHLYGTHPRVIVNHVKWFVPTIMKESVYISAVHRNDHCLWSHAVAHFCSLKLQTLVILFPSVKKKNMATLSFPTGLEVRPRIYRKKVWKNLYYLQTLYERKQKWQFLAIVLYCLQLLICFTF